MTRQHEQDTHAQDQEETWQVPPQKHKRKRETTPPQFPKKPSGLAGWDRTTFRVTRIPEEFALPRLSCALEEAFEMEDTLGFKIHSLASDAFDGREGSHKTSTISFRTRPASLQPTVDSPKEWKIDLPYTETNQRKYVCVLFDTRFDGFTPLSSVKDEGRYTIEYDLNTHERATAKYCSCIAIHGWAGHALGSFRSPSSTYVWLRDALPEHCPRLRVWTYGYASGLTDPDSIEDVFEYAETFRRHLRILRQKTKVTTS